MSNGSIQGQTYLSLQGGELQGNVEMNGNKITGLGNAVDDGDAVRLGQLNSYSPAGGLMGMMKLAKSGTRAESNNVTVEFDYVPMFIVIKLKGVYVIDSGGGISPGAIIATDSSGYEQTFQLNNGRITFDSNTPKEVLGVAMLSHSSGRSAEALTYTQLNIQYGTDPDPTHLFEIKNSNNISNIKPGFFLKYINVTGHFGTQTTRGTFDTFEIYYL